jgi:hypothetical protein
MYELLSQALGMGTDTITKGLGVRGEGLGLVLGKDTTA